MRLFVGLDLPQDVRQHLAATRTGMNGARWVALENFHITLRFIGEVDRHQAADLDAALDDILAPAFDLTLRGVGKFATRGRLRAVWAGVEPSAALAHLHDKVERACVIAGFQSEQRKFKPHVTLARFKGAPEQVAGGFLEDHAGFVSRDVAVARFTLFESTLGHEGAHYTALRTYGFGGQDYDFDGLAEEFADQASAQSA